MTDEKTCSKGKSSTRIYNIFFFSGCPNNFNSHWFSIAFLSKTWFRAKMYQYFMCFNRFCENKDAVAAAALVGGPSRCSHSIIIFANVDISQVLARFFVEVSTEQVWRALTSPLSRPRGKTIFLYCCIGTPGGVLYPTLAKLRSRFASFGRLKASFFAIFSSFLLRDS